MAPAAKRMGARRRGKRDKTRRPRNVGIAVGNFCTNKKEAIYTLHLQWRGGAHENKKQMCGSNILDVSMAYNLCLVMFFPQAKCVWLCVCIVHIAVDESGGIKTNYWTIELPAQLLACFLKIETQKNTHFSVKSIRLATVLHILLNRKTFKTNIKHKNVIIFSQFRCQ